MRLLQTASQHIRLPEGETTDCLDAYSFRRRALFYRLGEQRYGIGDAPAQSVHSPPGGSQLGETLIR